MHLKSLISSPACRGLRALYSKNAQWPSWKMLMRDVVDAENCMDIERIRMKCIQAVCRRVSSCELERADDQAGSGLENMLESVSTRIAEYACGDEAAYGGEIADISHELSEFLALEYVARKGWTRVIDAFSAGVGTGVETVDQHCVKTAVLASLLCPESANTLFVMGLIHDHAEQIIGDLTPGEVASRSEKKHREKQAYAQMLEKSGIGEIKRKWLKEAFEDCMSESVNAQWIHLADKLDMSMQAWLYERQFHVCLSEFFDSAAEDIEHALYMMTSKKNCDT